MIKIRNSGKKRRIQAAVAGILAAAILVLFSALSVYAVPALGGLASFTQPDGSRFERRMIGDEYFHYDLDGKGRLIQTDKKDGYWRYVTYGAGGSLALSGKAGGTVPDALFDVSRLSEERYREQYYELAGKKYIYLEPASLDPISLDDIPDNPGNGTASNAFLSAERAGSTGNAEKTIPLVAVVIGFPNIDYSNDYDWGSILFHQPGNDVSDYFARMSEGKFTFSPAAEQSRYGLEGNTNPYDREDDGIIHVRISSNHMNWGSKYNTGELGKHAFMKDDYYEVFVEALAQAEKVIDFPSYDADGNGILSREEFGLVFLFAGGEAAVSSDQGMPSIWSNRWDFYPGIETVNAEGDRVKAGSHIAVAENCKIDSVMRHGLVGVVMHELGHYIGLPDLYDVNYTENGEWGGFSVSFASLMAAGNWGATGFLWKPDSEPVPTFLDSWCRKELGFCTPLEITESGTYPVDRLGSGGAHESYMIRTPHEDEYYLIENREFTSFDRGMMNSYGLIKPSIFRQGGIIVWHIDQGIADGTKDYNQVNVQTHRPGVMPLFYEIGSESDADEYQAEIFQKFADLQNQSAVPNPIWTYPMRNQEAFYNNPFPTKIYNGDLKANRKNSGIIIQAVSGPGETMQVKVIIPKYKALKDITGIPDAMVLGKSLRLEGICTPSDATHQDITWEIVNDGGTGASLTDKNILEAGNTGTITLKATVPLGATETQDFTKIFRIKASPLILNNVVKGDILYSGGEAVYLASASNAGLTGPVASSSNADAAQASVSNASPSDSYGEGFLEDGEVIGQKNSVFNNLQTVPGAAAERSATESDAACVRFYRNAGDTVAEKIQEFTANISQALESGFDNLKKWLVSKVTSIGRLRYIDVIPARLDTYTITASAGEGGTISPSGAVRAAEGSDVTFTFTPKSGYRVWQVISDTYDDQGRIGTYTFKNISGNSTIHVDFEKIKSSGGDESHNNPGSKSHDRSGSDDADDYAWRVAAHDSQYDGAWHQDGTVWRFRYNRGGYARDTWLLVSRKWYHFNTAGYAQKGWIPDKGKWYYLDPVNCGMKTGWHEDPQDHHMYYLNADGSMAAGRVEIGGKWYYFNTDMSAAAYTYDAAGGMWTWKGEDIIPYGAMLKDTITPDGNHVDGNGVIAD